MKKFIFCILAITAFIFNTNFAQVDTTTVNLGVQVKEYIYNIDDLQSKRSKLDLFLKDSLSKILELDSVYTKEKKSSKEIILLRDRIKLLEEYNSKKEKVDKEILANRFNFGKTALKDMYNGVIMVGFMESLLHIETYTGMTMNLWADSSFRNFWDDVQDYGLGIGLLTAGVSVIADKNKANTVTTAGLSIAGLTYVIGALFGQDNGNKFREKAEFIDLTRRAYDDLQIRYYLVKRYAKTCEDFEKRLLGFLNNYNKNAKSLEDSLYNIMQVKEYYKEYEIVLKQIPNYLDQFESMQAQFVILHNKKMNQILKNIIDETKIIRDKYNKYIIPILDLSKEIKIILLT